MPNSLPALIGRILPVRGGTTSPASNWWDASGRFWIQRLWADCGDCIEFRRPQEQINVGPAKAALLDGDESRLLQFPDIAAGLSVGTAEADTEGLQRRVAVAVLACKPEEADVAEFGPGTEAAMFD
jgi:hypothetical protein